MVEFITPESCVKIRVGFKNPTEHTENYNYTEYKDNNEIEDTSVIKINSSNISEKQLIVTITDKGPEGTPAEN